MISGSVVGLSLSNQYNLRGNERKTLDGKQIHNQLKGDLAASSSKNDNRHTSSIYIDKIQTRNQLQSIGNTKQQERQFKNSNFSSETRQANVHHQRSHNFNMEQIKQQILAVGSLTGATRNQGISNAITKTIYGNFVAKND